MTKIWMTKDDDGVDECSDEDDEEVKGRRWRNGKLIRFCWLTIR